MWRKEEQKRRIPWAAVVQGMSVGCGWGPLAQRQRTAGLGREEEVASSDLSITHSSVSSSSLLPVRNARSVCPFRKGVGGLEEEDE
jgi:hypothetical protein